MDYDIQPYFLIDYACRKCIKCMYKINMSSRVYDLGYIHNILLKRNISFLILLICFSFLREGVTVSVLIIFILGLGLP